MFRSKPAGEKKSHGARPPRVTPADLVVMAVLAEKPAHGYDIVASLERLDAGAGGGGKPEVSKAQIYYSLKKLLSLGYVLGAKDDGASGGPERETYRLSAPGHRAMGAAIASPDWPQERPPISFTTWLMVLGHAAPGDRASALKRRRAYIAQQTSHHRMIVERNEQEGVQGDRAAAMMAAAAKHAMEVLRMEREMLEAIEPMLGG